MTTYKTFEINQHALLKNSEDKVLILKQDNKWMLPGGRLEEYESPEDGLSKRIKRRDRIRKYKN